MTDPTGKTVTREGDVGRAKGDVADSIAEETRTEATGSLVVQLDDGRCAVLPRSYAEASTNLGYALTVFRSQGITVDHTFGLGGDSLYQEAGYTALSRGRLSNNLYVAAPENPRWEIGHHADDLAQRDALESLLGALSQSKEQTMARDRLPTWPSVSVEEFAVAYREHASLEKWIADHAPPDAVLQLADTSFGAVDSDERVRTRAQGDVTNSDAAKRRLAAWAVRHQAEIEMWSELEHELRRHEYRLGQAAAYSQPEHTVALLGPLPEHISGAERWQFAAGVIEAYRVRWNVTDADALGPEPVDPEQHAHWQRALSALGSAGLAEPRGPGEGPDEAWVSSLWDRVHALDDERHEPRDVTSVSEQAHLAWSRSVHDGQGFDGGLGI